MKSTPVSFSAIAYLVIAIIICLGFGSAWMFRPQATDYSALSKNIADFSTVPADRFSSVGPRVATDLKGQAGFSETARLAEKTVNTFDRRASLPKDAFESLRVQVLPTFLVELERRRTDEFRELTMYLGGTGAIGVLVLVGVSVLAYYRERRATTLVVEMIRTLKSSHFLGPTYFTTLFSSLKRVRNQVKQLDDAYSVKDRDLTMYIRLAAMERRRYEDANRDLNEFLETQGTAGENPVVVELINEVKMRATGGMKAVTYDPVDMPAVLQSPVDTEVDGRFPYLSKCHLVAGLLTPFRYEVTIPSMDNLLGVYDSTDVIKVILDRVCQALFGLGYLETQLSYSDHHLRITVPNQSDISDSEARSIENRVISFAKNEISAPLIFRGAPISMPPIRVEVSEDTRRYIDMI